MRPFLLSLFFDVLALDIKVVSDAGFSKQLTHQIFLQLARCFHYLRRHGILNFSAVSCCLKVLDATDHIHDITSLVVLDYTLNREIRE